MSLSKEDVQELVSDFCSQIYRAFGVTASAGESGVQEPGALEVLADALSHGRWTVSGGVAKNIGDLAGAVDHCAESVENVAESIAKVAQSIDRATDKICKALTPKPE